MKKFFETTEPIYHESKYLEISTRYRKGKGYEIVVEPVGIKYFDDNPNNSFMVSKCFDSDYYNHYMDMITLVKPCQRKSASALAYAEEVMSTNVDKFIQQYIELALANGGKQIELSGKVITTLS